MALPSPETYAFEDGISSTAGERLNLHQLMFSTNFQDAVPNGLKGASSNPLQNIKREPKQNETSNRNGGKKSALAIAGGAVFSEDVLDQERASSRKNLTCVDVKASPRAFFTTAAAGESPGIDMGETNASRALREAATFCTKAVVTIVSTNRRPIAETSNKVIPLVPTREARIQTVRSRKKIKRLRVFPSAEDKNEDACSQSNYHTFPLEERLTATPPGGTRVSETNDFSKTTSDGTKVHEGARRAAATADCWTEITEEGAGQLKVSVGRGNTCITKRFCSTDSSKRLPELMLNAGGFVCQTYLPVMFATEGRTPSESTPAEANGALANAAEPSRNKASPPCSATTADGAPSAGVETPKTPSLSPASHCCRAKGNECDDCRGKRFRLCSISRSGLEAFTTSSAERVQASAQLYSDWVCKHFDQVEHYLHNSRNLIERDTRSRQRAATVAMQLVLTISQDIEQQRYLQWITAFLNSLCPSATADPSFTHEELAVLQSTSMNILSGKQFSANASYTNISPTEVHQMPCTSAHKMATPPPPLQARVSPGSAATQKHVQENRSATMCPESFVIAHYPVEAPVSEPPGSCSDTALVAAQLLENLRLLESIESSLGYPRLIEPASRLAFANNPTGFPFNSPLEGTLVAPGEKNISFARPEDLHRHGATPRLPVGHIGLAVLEAAAHELKEANGGIAPKCSISGAATGAGRDNLARPRIGASIIGPVELISPSPPEVVTVLNTVASEDANGGPPERVKRGIPGAAAATIEDAVKEAARQEWKGEAHGASSESTAGAMVEARENAAVEPAKRFTLRAAESGDDVAASAVRSESVITAAPAGAVGTTAAVADLAAGCTVRTGSTILTESEVAHLDLERGAATKGLALAGERCYCEQPKQLGTSDVGSGRVLADEMMDAANALVRSVSHEKEAMAWIEQNDFSSILQMLQAALEEPSRKLQQHLQQQGQLKQMPPRLQEGLQHIGQHGQHQLQQSESEGLATYRQNPSAVQEQQQQKAPSIFEHQQPEQNARTPQHENGKLYTQQNQQNADHYLQWPNRQRWQHMHEQSTQQNVQALALQSRQHMLHQKQQPQENLLQEQLLQELLDPDKLEPNAQSSVIAADQDWRQQQLENGKHSKICAFLCSLLSKHLSPASDSVYHEGALLQETTLSSHDTDCSSHNSRKVSSCSAQLPVQCDNSSTTHAKETFCTSHVRSSRATQTTWRHTEVAVPSSAFPCFSEESVKPSATEFSVCTSIPSSTNASTTSTDVGSLPSDVSFFHSSGQLPWAPTQDDSHTGAPLRQ